MGHSDRSSRHLHANPAARVARHGDTHEAVVERLLDTGGVQDRNAVRSDGVLRPWLNKSPEQKLLHNSRSVCDWLCDLRYL